MFYRNDMSKYKLFEWLLCKKAAIKSCLGLMIFFIYPTVTAAAAEIQYKSFPVPIRIDHSYRVKSSLWFLSRWDIPKRPRRDGLFWHMDPRYVLGT